MSEQERKRWAGAGWLALIAIPPVVVVVGLVVFLAWQVREGKVSPKWKPKAAITNQAPDAGIVR